MVMNALPLDMDPQELVDAQRAGRLVVLVDCREQWEYDVVHLPDSLLIPLGELSSRAAEIPRSDLVVVYCHHGIRSRHGAAMLRRAGLETARSLAGGIEEWATSVDSSLPRY